jgi:hypothetical protein
MTSRVADLLRRNLLDVFNERDPDRRALAVAEIYDADRRDAKGQMALFTADTRFVVFMDATASEPRQELHGRESLAPVFDNLKVDWTETRPSAP